MLDQAGFRLVNFVHDEYIAELQRCAQLQDDVQRFKRIMVEGMDAVLPDVTVRVDPILMNRWYKYVGDMEAETIYDTSGNLLVWTPDILEYDKKEHGEIAPEQYEQVAAERNAVTLIDKKGKLFGWQSHENYVDWSAVA